MYIRCLDGLRALAIILVIFAHAIHSGIPTWLKDTFQFWNAGTVGVRLFFLISGFLITTILNNEIKKNGKINFKKFLIRRTLRIFPAFYFYLITLGVLSYLGIINIDFNAVMFAFLYIQNMNMFQKNELFPTSWLVKHSWSLSVEEQFYVIYPFVLHKIKNVLHNNFIVTIIVVNIVCSFFRCLNYSFPDVSRMTGGVFIMHCDFLIYGAVLALYMEDYKDYLAKHIAPFKYVLLVTATVILVYSSRIEYFSVINILISGNLILYCNLYVLLFFILFPYSTLGKVFEYKPIKWIGKLSYSLYIWQQLFLGSTHLWLQYKILSIYPYNFAMIAICAVFSYFLIEKPFLKLKDKYFNQ